MKPLILASLLCFAASPLAAASAGQGLQYLDSGRYDLAIAEFKALSDAAEDCRYCGFYLGIAQYRSGMLSEARASVSAELGVSDGSEKRALALGYAFLIMAKQPDTGWFEECLASSQRLKDAPPADALFLAQDIVDATGQTVVGTGLRDTAADEVLRLVDVLRQGPGSALVGVLNAKGRALILKSEVAALKGQKGGDEGMLTQALQAFQGEQSAHPSAIILHNQSIAQRLIGELKELRFWDVKPMSSKNPEAVQLAAAAGDAYQASLDILKPAPALADYQKYKDKLSSLQALNEQLFKGFASNASVRKVLKR